LVDELRVDRDELRSQLTWEKFAPVGTIGASCSRMSRRTYSDDRATGEWTTSLRGSRRVTVVARAEDRTGYESVAALKRDYLPPRTEAKSALVLPIFDARPEARALVSKAVASYAIVLVDVNEFARQMAQDLVDRLCFVVPPAMDPFEFVVNLPDANSNARLFLRQAALNKSILGRLEAVMEWSANPFSEEFERAGLAEYAGHPQVSLADRERLLEWTIGRWRTSWRDSELQLGTRSRRNGRLRSSSARS
jgi:Lon protease-like protein